MNLLQVAMKSRVRLLNIKGGSKVKEELTRRGINIGDKMTVLSHLLLQSGVIIEDRHGARFAIGKSLARNIEVESL